MKQNNFIRGRGAQQNTPNKFLKHIHEIQQDFLEFCRKEGEEAIQRKTQYLAVFPKTIVNKGCINLIGSISVRVSLFNE